MPAKPRILPYGERAVLLEVGSIAEVLGVHDTVIDLDLPGVEDVVPASVTVLVSFADPPALQSALPALQAIAITEGSHRDGALVTIDVVYDGADLADVAELTGFSESEVIARHSGSDFVVAFSGFAPGFAYLTGVDPALHVPRRDSPRTRVPAGSLGMTGQFTAVYPRESPGGWQLLGHTTTKMWDESADSPALLGPGMRVTFQPVRA